MDLAGAIHLFQVFYYRFCDHFCSCLKSLSKARQVPSLVAASLWHSSMMVHLHWPWHRYPGLLGCDLNYISKWIIARFIINYKKRERERCMLTFLLRNDAIACCWARFGQWCSHHICVLWLCLLKRSLCRCLALAVVLHVEIVRCVALLWLLDLRFVWVLSAVVRLASSRICSRLDKTTATVW